jgi:hypothetical protein
MADKRRFAAPHSDLQNALARIGALQLQESTDVLPSERLGDVSPVIREVIVAPSCRDRSPRSLPCS